VKILKKDSLFKGTAILSLSLILTKVLGAVYLIPFYQIIGGEEQMALFNYGYSYYATLLEISAAGTPLAIAKLVAKYNALGAYSISRRIYRLGSWLLVLMGIVGLYAILERFFYFASKERNNYSKLPSEVKQLIKEGKIKESIIYLNSNKSSTSVVLKEILIYGYKENKETLSALEEKGKEKAIEQIKHLERNMWLLSLAANASPLLGLLGTVTGMITAFNSIALNGTGDAGVLAKGISEALYTTAGGLFVAIPCMIFYNYFNKRIDLVVTDIEKTCTELLNYFRE